MRTTLALYRALKSVNVSDENAKAVVDALEADMQSQLATKTDVQALASDIKTTQAEIKALDSDLRAEIKVLGSDLRAEIRAVALAQGYTVKILKWIAGFAATAVLLPVAKDFVLPLLKAIIARQ